MEKKKQKKEKGKAAFGWDIFNQDSLHKGAPRVRANRARSFSKLVL
jgi:hypothetical protein